MRILLALAAALMLAACSALTAFDTVAPKDPAGGRTLTDLSFGDLARHRLDLYPPVNAAGPAPVVVFIYGGGWDSGRRQDYTFAGRALAAQGFLTLVPDYRLVPEVRFPTFLEDAARAVKWAQDNAAAHGGDPSRIVLMGHSAGAYNAMMLGLDPRYLAGAGADPGAIRGVIGLAGPYDFLPLDVAASINAFGQAPDLAATQPVNFARADAPPVLLLHGATDETVRPRNSEALAARLKAAGAEAKLILYPDVDHAQILTALSRPFRGGAPTLQDSADFVRRVTAAER